MLDTLINNNSFDYKVVKTSRVAVIFTFFSFVFRVVASHRGNDTFTGFQKAKRNVGLGESYKQININFSN
jgi:hypothetical protein